MRAAASYTQWLGGSGLPLPVAVERSAQLRWELLVRVLSRTIKAPASSAPGDPMFFKTIEQVRRFSRILAGFTLLLVGVIMFFTPGPGWLVIFLGLTLLAAEFVWARRLMDRMKHEGNRLKDTVLRLNRG